MVNGIDYCHRRQSKLRLRAAMPHALNRRVAAINSPRPPEGNNRAGVAIEATEPLVPLGTNNPRHDIVRAVRARD